MRPRYYALQPCRMSPAFNKVKEITGGDRPPIKGAGELPMGNLFDLTGKVAVITGSTKGIGKAMAQRMAEHGAKVVISSRKADICDQVASEITAAGGTAMAIPCNISDESQLQNLVDKTIAAWGGIDVLVCNAAANP